MSERGSFVTEFVYCPGCLKAVQDALTVAKLPIVRVPKPADVPGDERFFPIIAGKIGCLTAGGEVRVLREILERSPRPCHSVILAVFSENGGLYELVLDPVGNPCRL